MNRFIKKAIPLLVAAVMILSMVPAQKAGASSSGHLSISVSPKELASEGNVTVSITLTNTNSNYTPTNPPQNTTQPTNPPVVTNPPAQPTDAPTAPPTDVPATPAPTDAPTPAPTDEPTAAPTIAPINPPGHEGSLSVGGAAFAPASGGSSSGFAIMTSSGLRSSGKGDYTNISISNSYGVTFNTTGVVIPAGGAKTFTSTMHVSSGMIGVSIPFTVSWIDNGNRKSETISCKVNRLNTSPYLAFSRKADPVNASEGTEVTVTYSFTNTGSVKLTNITLVDPQIKGSTSPMLSPFSLDPGESKEFPYTFTMGNSTVVSNPVVTFYAQGSYTQLTKTSSKLVIGLIQSQLTKDVVKGNPTPQGVSFTIYLTNNGNQTLNSLVVTDELGNKVSDEPFSLAVGESKVLEYFVPNPDAVRYIVFNINGVDYNDTEFKDNTSSYVVRPYIDTSLLGLAFTAVTKTSLTPENMISIEFEVQNTGSLEFYNLSVSEQQLGYELYSWNKLDVGASEEAVVDVNIGSVRDLVFVLTAEDSSGNTYTHEAYVTAENIDVDSMVPSADPSGSTGVEVVEEPGLGKKLDGLITSTGENLMKWFRVLGIIAGAAALTMLSLGIAEIVIRRNKRSEQQ